MVGYVIHKVCVFRTVQNNWPIIVKVDFYSLLTGLLYVLTLHVKVTSRWCNLKEP